MIWWDIFPNIENTRLTPPKKLAEQTPTFFHDTTAVVSAPECFSLPAHGAEAHLFQSDKWRKPPAEDTG
jgi:hypothetical protein